jgi:hypothetical protein
MKDTFTRSYEVCGLGNEVHWYLMRSARGDGEREVCE